jgi:hypothetical protein
VCVGLVPKNVDRASCDFAAFHSFDLVVSILTTPPSLGFRSARHRSHTVSGFKLFFVARAFLVCVVD